MSILSIHGEKSSRTIPVLRPAFFLLALLVFAALPVGAEELEANQAKPGGSHPVHPRYELSVTALEFAETPAEGSSEMTVTVTNNGPGTIPLKVRITEGGESFSLPGISGKHHLRPGESVDIEVMFAPMEPGDFVGYLHMGQQVPGIPLSGIGDQYPTDLVLDLEAIDFSEVIVDSTGTVYLKITNGGNEPYTLDPTLADDPTDFEVREGLSGFALLPGNFAYLTMYFTPLTVGPHATKLSLGPGLPRLDVTGMGLEGVGSCLVEPSELVFGPLSPGESQTLQLRITNNGNIDLPIAQQIEDPNFELSKNSTILGPGQSWVIAVTYSPLTWGMINAEIDLGNDYCDPVPCTGLPTEDFDEGMDNVGLFFDEELTSNRTTTTEYYEVVDFHLAMLNPSNNSGVAAWECRLGIEGKATITSASFAGQALNLGSENEYIVGIGGDPLPFAPSVRLASFQLLMMGNIGETVELGVYPRFISSLPGLMVWLSADDPYDLKPMFPRDGDPVVAIINEPGGGKYTGAALDKSAGAGVPAVTQILPNAPNPFNPQTEIRFELSRPGQAQLAIYDVTGRLVKTVHDGHLAAARHTMVWAGRDDGGRAVASGVYYLRMVTADGVMQRKMMLLK